MIPWHPHTEPPADDTATAVIAIPPLPGDDEDAGYRLDAGIFHWQQGRWVREDDNAAPSHPEFWWCAENDLLSHLMPRIRIRSNGHG